MLQTERRIQKEVFRRNRMKAVVVFDVDSDFDFDQKLWVQIEEYLDGEILESGCHSVRPLPSKRRKPFTKTFGTPYNIGKAEGWNRCLDEILGETNGKKKLL